jgi:hypothetical protein
MYQQQLQQAHDLIEQGRMAEARRLLLTLDDPTARQWLAQIDPNKVSYKRRSSLPLPLPLLIGLAALIGVVALLVIVLLTPTLLARVQAPGVQQQLAATDESLYASLHHLCTMTTGYGGGDACMDWTDLVLRDHHAVAADCLSGAEVETEDGRTRVGVCLAQNGVPEPF